MAIKSLEISNLLSFKSLKIENVEDLNCIVGKNNAGKSNLLKLMKFYFSKLDDKREILPELNSRYDPVGFIKVTFDTERINNIVRTQRNYKNKFFLRVGKLLFQSQDENSLKKRPFFWSHNIPEVKSYTLTLYIYSDGRTNWSVKDRDVHKIISYLYPFFEIEARHMNLHEWNKVWDVISKLKSFNLSKINNDDIINFFDEQLNSGHSSYSDFMSTLSDAIEIKGYSYRERILSYVNAGLKGKNFAVNGEALNLQSDGTNTYYFLDTLLTLLIALTRKEYITPTIFIDEPEIGLHPKRCELLIDSLFNTCNKFKYSEKGIKIKTPLPKIFFLTHSPNIVKDVIKKFQDNHQVLHISKSDKDGSSITKLDSKYSGSNFLSTFSDNESRLFFSDFILFVEGETELEAFENILLRSKFEQLKNVDIYKCSSNTIAERINPSATNSAIPYLFLYDADKAYDFKEVKPNRVSLILKKNGEIFNIKKPQLEIEVDYYNKGYSKQHRLIKKNISELILITNESHLVNKTKSSFHNEKTKIKIHRLIKQHLRTKEVQLLNTTFEGCLISTHSIEMFYSWLLEEKGTDLSKIVSLARRNKSEKRLIDLLRVIFNGKTDILVKRKNIKSHFSTNKWSVKYFEDLEKHINTNSKNKKTDGWVTSFINYSIRKIEQEETTTNDNFPAIFSRYFPELYGTIKLLQLDSYRELRMQ